MIRSYNHFTTRTLAHGSARPRNAVAHARTESAVQRGKSSNAHLRRAIHVAVHAAALFAGRAIRMPVRQGFVRLLSRRDPAAGMAICRLGSRGRASGAVCQAVCVSAARRGCLGRARAEQAPALLALQVARSSSSYAVLWLGACRAQSAHCDMYSSTLATPRSRHGLLQSNHLEHCCMWAL